ncbi:MAG: hypothetical protein NZ517_08560 [Candidatus Nitrosocaldus sp.]|nr:hypothetical protein [Candidatus Nitrosocaldus sp.]MDW8000457.1 hypothetical protein [Candidatus Nitrosocaldus sp.]
MSKRENFAVDVNSAKFIAKDHVELTSKLIINSDVNSAKFYYTGIAIPVEALPIFWEFKQLVIIKYGKVKGAFSKYLIELMEEEVLRYRASMQHHAANPLQNSMLSINDKIRTDTLARLRRIKQLLIEKAYIKEIPEQVLIETIKATGIRDLRTIKKYYQLCLKLGCKRVIKPYTVMIDIEYFINSAL